MNLYVVAALEEIADPITVVGLASIGLWGFADKLAESLSFLEAHQVALTGLVLFVFSMIKKIYQMKAAIADYLRGKEQDETED